MSRIIRATAGVIASQAAALSWTESVVSNNAGAAMLYKTSGLYFAPSTKIGLFAQKFKFPTTVPTSGRFFHTTGTGGNDAFYINFASDGRLSFLIKDTGAISRVSWTTSANTFVAGTLYHLVWSWRLDTGQNQIYLNGSSLSPSAATDGTTRDVVAIGVFGSTSHVAYGQECLLGPTIFDPSLSAFFDLSVAGNLDNIYPATNPGDGTPIVGAQMAVVLDGNAAALNNTSGNNKGYAGNLTVVSSFSDSAWS